MLLTTPSPLPFPRIPIQVHPKVQVALHSACAIVALESTIITHGLPYPTNLNTALALEAAVRTAGATPATIGVLRGRVHIGLTGEQLTTLATEKDRRKIARRDVGVAIAKKWNGGTTVSATMYLSRMVGIDVFATGGIGGVHRGVSDTWDVSADIGALAEGGQTVVCAGVKSILDIDKTVEALESAGVTVLVWKQDLFPGFYTRCSATRAGVRVENAEEVARIYAGVRGLGKGRGGVLLAVGIEQEFEADGKIVERAIELGLREMEEKGITGKDVTPFLLRRVGELTGGESDRANVRLAVNNARVGGEVAVRIAKIKREAMGEDERPEVLVVGGVGIDVVCDCKWKDVVMKTCNGGSIRMEAGGVGFNVGLAAKRFGEAKVAIVCSVGKDYVGEMLQGLMKEEGLDTRGVIRDGRTGIACVIHDGGGDLMMGIGDFDGMSNVVEKGRDVIAKLLEDVSIVCMDGNLSVDALGKVSRLCDEAGVKTWFEPTTTEKATRIVRAGIASEMHYMSPNEMELRNMGRAAGVLNVEGDRGLFECATTLLGEGRGVILCTRGAKGVRRFRANGNVKDFEAVKLVRVENSSGAGDCFAGACVAALAKGEEEDVAIEKGIKAAALCCASNKTVPHGGFVDALCLRQVAARL